MSAARIPLLLLLISAASALKEHDFRKCDDSPFCKSFRKSAPTEWTVKDVALAADGALRAQIVAPEPQLPLELTLSVLRSGAVRVQLDEDPSLPLASLERADFSSMPAEWDEEMDGEWDAPVVRAGRAVKQRLRPTQSFVSTDAAAPSGRCEHRTPAPGIDRLRCVLEGGAEAAVEVELRREPLTISVLNAQGEAVAVLNGRGRLLLEPFRQTLASETWQSETSEDTFNSFTDPMKYGVSAVGLDVDFPLASHAYGLPERTVAHALPPTLGKVRARVRVRVRVSLS